jgi:hypothetical protein
MMVQTLPNTGGGYNAAIQFHDGRQLVQFRTFRTADQARDYGEAWIREAVAAYARTLAETGRHIQPVES